MPTTAGTGPGWSWELGTLSSKTPMRVTGRKLLELSPAASREYALAGSWNGVGEPSG